MKDEAIRMVDEALQAIESTKLRGIDQILELGKLRAHDLRALVAGSEDDDLHRAVVQAFWLGFVHGGLNHKAVKKALDSSREKAVAAEVFDWKTIYMMAEEKGWSLPLNPAGKSRLKRLCLANLKAQGTTIHEKNFRKHYDVAVRYAEGFRDDERRQWIGRHVREICAEPRCKASDSALRSELLKLREKYKTEFDLDGRTFRKDLTRMRLTGLLEKMKRAK